MRRRIYILALIAFMVMPSALMAVTVNGAMGMYGGFAPSLGNDLQSAYQYYVYGTQSGVDGLNRAQDGYSTSAIERLIGFGGGIMFKLLLMDNYQFRLGANYTKSTLGGEGETLFGATPTTLECKYGFTMYDVPLTFGISIPFWKDIKIVFSCGFAYAYAKYTNRFIENSTTKHKGTFTGWGLPLVILIEGEYFITDRLALSSSLVYYRGSSKFIEDGSTSDGVTDYARINFTGYRYNAGVSFYFWSI